MGAPAYAPVPSRPLGVAIIAILVGLLGAFLLIVSILVLVVSGYAYLHAYAIFGTTLVGGVILLILAIIYLAVATGLWDLEMWALALSVIVLVVSIGADYYYNGITLGVIVLGLVLIYLIAVSRHFT